MYGVRTRYIHKYVTPEHRPESLPGGDLGLTRWAMSHSNLDVVIPWDWMRACVVLSTNYTRPCQWTFLSQDTQSSGLIGASAWSSSDTAVRWCRVRTTLSTSSMAAPSLASTSLRRSAPKMARSLCHKPTGWHFWGHSSEWCLGSSDTITSASTPPNPICCFARNMQTVRRNPSAYYWTRVSSRQHTDRRRWHLPGWISPGRTTCTTRSGSSAHRTRET